jgi:hypothetical protein
MSDAKTRMVLIKKRLRWSSEKVMLDALRDIAEIATGKNDAAELRKANVGRNRMDRGGRDRSAE